MRPCRRYGKSRTIFGNRFTRSFCKWTRPKLRAASVLTPGESWTVSYSACVPVATATACPVNWETTAPSAVPSGAGELGILECIWAGLIEECKEWEPRNGNDRPQSSPLVIRQIPASQLPHLSFQSGSFSLGPTFGLANTPYHFSGLSCR